MVSLSINEFAKRTTKSSSSHQIQMYLFFCTAMQKTMGKTLYLMTGVGNRFRLIDIAAVSDALGHEIKKYEKEDKK